MNQELYVNETEMITSSTDKQGKIIYVNDVFCKMVGYTREELIGKPHSVVRHPDMPKAVFKLLWETILQGKPMYAFVKNRTKDGDYYWVKGLVKPIIKNGEVVKIISFRKPINTFAKEVISQLYATLIEYEKTHSADESLQFLKSYLKERNISYETLINRLSQDKNITNVDAINIDIQKFHTDHIIFRMNIIDKVKRGTPIEVVDSCCCAFGKELKRLDGKSFTSHPGWEALHTAHDSVHAHMKEYVQKAQDGASSSELESILETVNGDTATIFKNLVDVVDHAK